MSGKIDSNLNTFLKIGGLSQDDESRLTQISALVTPALAEMTDRFYAILQEDSQTAPYLVGRLDSLKSTHLQWMKDLFSGNYGDEFIKRQQFIGEVHVRVKVPPVFVAASMSFLRAAIPAIIAKHITNDSDVSKASSAVMRLLDLCHYLIDRKYSEALMENLGISPALLLRLQSLAKKI